MHTTAKFGDYVFHEENSELQSTDANEQEPLDKQIQVSSESCLSLYNVFIHLEQYAFVESALETNCKVLIPLKTADDFIRMLVEEITPISLFEKCIFKDCVRHSFYFQANFVFEYINKYIPYINAFYEHRYNEACSKEIITHMSNRYFIYFFDFLYEKVSGFLCDIYDCFGHEENLISTSQLMRESDVFIITGNFFPENFSRNRIIFERIASSFSFSYYDFKHAVFANSNVYSVSGVSKMCGFEITDSFFECDFFKESETCVYFIFKKN